MTLEIAVGGRAELAKIAKRIRGGLVKISMISRKREKEKTLQASAFVRFAAFM
ncbi:MAG: hypothetical protein OHK005_09520 [Candidatus Methylacidiphilales bacterium]